MTKVPITQIIKKKIAHFDLLPICPIFCFNNRHKLYTVNIKQMIINESRRFTVFDEKVLNLDIIYNKLYPVNLFYPDTLINTKRALWTNARIFRGWSSGDTLRKVCSLLQILSLFLTDANILGSLPDSSHWLMVFGYGILVDSTSTIHFII